MRHVAAAVAVLSGLGLVLLTGHEGRAQVTIPSTTSTTSRPNPTTTAKPAATTTSAPTGPTTTARPRSSTTAPPQTAPQRTTSTIPTPAPSPTTTEAPLPLSRHSGHFSPTLSVLAVFGLLAGLGLLAWQWFLTRPGRRGWTL